VLWTNAHKSEAAPVAYAEHAQAPAPPPGLTRLPHTSKEVRDIAALFGADQRTYLRDRATEEAAKTGAFEGARIVHIASHGLLATHFQGLVLTVNPDSKEDGLLLSSEIAELKLNADLVVLSACQTGNTHLRDDQPVAGLALALRTAGARRVVVSLWSVDDAATASLMLGFYKPLVKGTGYGEALALAKRELMKTHASPYFWAPFVLLGD
jgi:CHAT domain-containing protein